MLKGSCVCRILTDTNINPTYLKNIAKKCEEDQQRTISIMQYKDKPKNYCVDTFPDLSGSVLH